MHPECDGCKKKLSQCMTYKFYEFVYEYCMCKECIIKVNCFESCRKKIDLILWADRLSKPCGQII